MLGKKRFIKSFVLKKFGYKIVLVLENFAQKVSSKLGQKQLRKFQPKKIVVSKKFGSNKILSQKIKALKKLGQKSLVKIGSVTAEMDKCLHVAWTNVTLTVSSS